MAHRSSHEGGGGEGGIAGDVGCRHRVLSGRAHQVYAGGQRADTRIRKLGLPVPFPSIPYRRCRLPGAQGPERTLAVPTFKVAPIRLVGSERFCRMNIQGDNAQRRKTHQSGSRIPCPLNYGHRSFKFRSRSKDRTRVRASQEAQKGRCLSTKERILIRNVLEGTVLIRTERGDCQVPDGTAANALAISELFSFPSMSGGCLNSPLPGIGFLYSNATIRSRFRNTQRVLNGSCRRYF